MAQRLIDAARFERRLMFTVDRDEICDDCLLNFLNKMAEEPTIDPVKHGRWVLEVIPPKNGSDGLHVIGRCSECGCTDSIPHSKCMGDLGNGLYAIWGGFFPNYKGHEEQAKIFAIESAKRKSIVDSFKFCPNCGTCMDANE